MRKTLLRVEAPHFVAGCVWVEGPDGWHVDTKQCAPILMWVSGKNPNFIKTYIRSRGWRYQAMPVD